MIYPILGQTLPHLCKARSAKENLMKAGPRPGMAWVGRVSVHAPQGSAARPWEIIDWTRTTAHAWRVGVDCRSHAVGRWH
jgi:hypothetical protein